MSKFTINIDGKSFFLGLLICCGLFVLSGFNSANQQSRTGRYQVATDDERDIILDSETGEFILNQSSLKPDFVKFKFENVEYAPARKKKK